MRPMGCDPRESPVAINSSLTPVSAISLPKTPATADRDAVARLRRFDPLKAARSWFRYLNFAKSHFSRSLTDAS
jgi:hypothetical protein